MENNKKKIAIDVDQNYDLMMVRPYRHHYVGR